MQLPLQTTFRHMPRSEEIAALAQAKAAKLETFSDHIMSCRVVIEPMGKHQQHGNAYAVRIDLTVPGEEIVVTQNPGAEYRDIPTALRDAFDSAARQVQDYVRRKRGFVKTLEASPQARVHKLFRDDGYGFLTTLDGREIFFHKNSVLNNGFARLDVGTEVTFAEEPGDEGPQASTVKIAGGHGHR